MNKFDCFWLAVEQVLEQFRVSNGDAIADRDIAWKSNFKVNMLALLILLATHIPVQDQDTQLLRWEQPS